MRARALIAALVALSVAGGGAAGAQAATTSTIIACVTTKTGAVKILTTAKARKKKCAKGAKKMTWDVPGRAGADGKNGADGSSTNGTDGTNGTNGTHVSPLNVYGPDGRVLGQFAELAGGNAQFNAFSVMVDGGLYTYVPEGILSNSADYLAVAGGVVYTDAACAGQPVLTLPRRYADTLNRSTYRFVKTMIFTADVWRAGSTTSTVPAAAPTYYAIDSGTGHCLVATGVQAGDSMVDLVPTTSPPVLVGPLTIAP
jgi:hypothetical protein